MLTQNSALMQLYENASWCIRVLKSKGWGSVPFHTLPFASLFFSLPFPYSPSLQPPSMFPAILSLPYSSLFQEFAAFPSFQLQSLDDLICGTLPHLFESFQTRWSIL